jgi:hypothetical protein
LSVCLMGKFADEGKARCADTDVERRRFLWSGHCI